MINYLKDRILLFVVVIAGDWVSLSAFIKADAIRQDAITTAIVVSLLPSIIISLIVEFLLLGKIAKQKLIVGGIISGLACWIAFVMLLMQFNTINDRYGKIPFPVNPALKNSHDSLIIGGCMYTPEAQAEVDDFKRRSETLPMQLLLADFNYEVAAIWTDESRDCARAKILKAFAVMLAFLITGITITIEVIMAIKRKPEGISTAA